MNIKALKDEEILKLKNNELIIKQLESKNLQKILIDINNSENSDQQLEKYLNNNEHFDQFMQKVLIQLNLLEINY